MNLPQQLNCTNFNREIQLIYLANTRLTAFLVVVASVAQAFLGCPSLLLPQWIKRQQAQESLACNQSERLLLETTEEEERSESKLKHWLLVKRFVAAASFMGT